MIQYNLTHWPLVLSAVHRSLTLEDQLALFGEWTAWFDHGGSYRADCPNISGNDQHSDAQNGYGHRSASSTRNRLAA